MAGERTHHADQRLIDGIFDAIEAGDARGLKLDLERRIPEARLAEFVNAKNENGQTPLHKAAESNNVEFIEILLSAHADLFIEDDKGNTPLYVAVMFSSNDAVSLILKTVSSDKELLEKLIDTANEDGLSPLAKAIHDGNVDTVKLFMPFISKTQQDSEGNDLLQQAVLSGCPSLVRYLVEEEKCDLTAKNKKGQTALDIALSDKQKMVLLPYLKTGTTRTPFQLLSAKFAAEAEERKIAAINFVQRADAEYQRATQSIFRADIEALDYLQGDKQSKIKRIIDYIKTTKIFPTQNYFYSLVSHILRYESVETCKYFIDVIKESSSVDQSFYLTNIMIMAATYNRVDILNYLLNEKKLSPNTFSVFSEIKTSPLSAALLYQHPEATKFLLGNKAEIDEATRDVFKTLWLQSLLYLVRENLSQSNFKFDPSSMFLPVIEEKGLNSDEFSLSVAESDSAKVEDEKKDTARSEALSLPPDFLFMKKEARPKVVHPQKEKIDSMDADLIAEADKILDKILNLPSDLESDKLRESIIEPFEEIVKKQLGEDAVQSFSLSLASRFNELLPMIQVLREYVKLRSKEEGSEEFKISVKRPKQ